MHDMRAIEFWFDFASNYCHPAVMRDERGRGVALRRPRRGAGRIPPSPAGIRGRETLLAYFTRLLVSGTTWAIMSR